MHFVRRANEDPKSERIRQMLLHRAEQLVELLKLPVLPKETVAQEVLLIFKEGLAYCDRLLSNIFLEWLVNDSIKEVSACKNCKSFKKESFADCSSCEKKSTPVH